MSLQAQRIDTLSQTGQRSRRGPDHCPVSLTRPRATHHRLREEVTAGIPSRRTVRCCAARG